VLASRRRVDAGGLQCGLVETLGCRHVGHPDGHVVEHGGDYGKLPWSMAPELVQAAEAFSGHFDAVAGGLITAITSYNVEVG